MGSVLGRRIARNSVQRLAPSARAASIRRESTMRTAWLALTRNGNVAAYDTTNKAALPRTPSHKIAIGIHAIGAIERKPSSTGRNDRSSGRSVPTARPSGMPISAPIEKPIATRCKLPAIASKITPLVISASPRTGRSPTGTGTEALGSAGPHRDFP
jgi:hypothetical protein